MTFTGNEDHSFPLETASDWTANYRSSSSANAIKAHYFGRNAILGILGQEGCVGIRIYYALDDNGVQQLVVVGVDSAGNDMYQGLLAERSYPCPSQCSTSNPLNS